MNAWPHQTRAVADTLAALARGCRRICVAAPTGAGKTFVLAELARNYLARGQKVVLYTNRTMLLEQTSRVLGEADLMHGVRAAGYDDDRDHPFQVASIQTEHSRVMRKGTWHLHEAELVLVDEAHVQKGPTTKRILDAHIEEGASHVGFTATPLGIGDLYDTLLVAGTTSELRDCGALVLAQHYGPDEPDLRHIGRTALGEDLTEKQNVAAMMTHGIFGRVVHWYKELNPEGKPAILFAPGVAESLWFAEQFVAAGISAAHIDGSEVWINGESRPTDWRSRRDALAGSRDGSIAVLCNRFVLREGIDAPWLAHGIFATIFGSLQSYLQAGGRLLRAAPSLDAVTIQDHGGNWWRHGSLNADRVWSLEYTPAIATGLHEEALRGGQKPQPVRCPQCSRILFSPRCPCGFTVDVSKRSRPVIQQDGQMKEMKGDIFKPRRISKAKNGPQLWERMYHRSKTKKGARTFRAAAVLFAQENYWGWPDPTWPLMPREPMDWFRLVEDVPVERLTPKEVHTS